MKYFSSYSELRSVVKFLYLQKWVLLIGALIGFWSGLYYTLNNYYLFKSYTNFANSEPFNRAPEEVVNVLKSITKEASFNEQLNSKMNYADFLNRYSLLTKTIFWFYSKFSKNGHYGVEIDFGNHGIGIYIVVRSYFPNLGPSITLIASELVNAAIESRNISLNKEHHLSTFTTSNVMLIADEVDPLFSQWLYLGAFAGVYITFLINILFNICFRENKFAEKLTMREL